SPPLPVQKRPAAKKQPEAKKIILPSGVRLILKEDHALPIVAITACFQGGLLAETPKNNGIGALMAHCITKGTRERSSLEVAETIEKTAGQLEGFSGKNSFGLRSEFLAEYTEKALGLFFEVLFEPAWDPKEFAKEKAFNLEAIRNLEDNLSALAFHHFQKTLFNHHPYGMRELGDKKSLQALTPAHLKQWHQKILGAKNMVLSMVGDISEKEGAALLNKHLGGLSKKGYPFAKPPSARKPGQIQRTVVTKKKEQAHLVLGFLGPTFTSPDYYPMTVLNDILSGMGGRLFIELRDKLSLAYSVTSVYSAGLDPGYFAVYIGCEPAKVSTATQAIQKELEKIIAAPVEPKELEKTKQHLVGTYELELQRNLGLSQMFGFDELYGQGFKDVLRFPEKILRVTREDVLNAAKKYIDLKSYVLSIVQP
ncbi:MAG: insulinase family protein, partial [Deltaproteobacteria bacterium]|nr:insulinase family protein [Deltaproteobacteria bacterium]